MYIPLMSIADLNNFWLNPGRAFIDLLINKKKKQRMIFTEKSATFAIENEDNFFSTEYPDKTLFYVDMDAELSENILVFIIDIRNDQFKIIRYGNMFYKKISADAIIGVIVEVCIL